MFDLHYLFLVVPVAIVVSWAVVVWKTVQGDDGVALRPWRREEQMIDLDAIRKRNEERKSGRCYECGHTHDELSGVNTGDPRSDIDALMAEVERLSSEVNRYRREAKEFHSAMVKAEMHGGTPRG